MKTTRRSFLKTSSLIPAAAIIGGGLAFKHLVVAEGASGSTSCNSYCKLTGASIPIPENYAELSLLEKSQAMDNFLGPTTEDNFTPSFDDDGKLVHVIYTETRENTVEGRKCDDVPELFYACEWPIQLYLKGKGENDPWILLGTSVATALMLYCPEGSALTLSANFDIAISAALGYTYNEASHSIYAIIDIKANPDCYGEDF